MKKILTFFTAFAAAAVFAFLLSASPEAVKAQNIKAEKFSSGKITLPSASQTVNLERFAVIAPDGLFVMTHRMREITPRIEPKQSNYQLPIFNRFTGFDKPARGKI